MLPAPAGSGIRFRRVDLDGRPEIEVNIENVTDTTRSTTISRGNTKVQTIEHVLAALSGCGIHNAVLELDANEPPIADGSSREFTRLIQKAGIESQPDPVEPLVIRAPLELRLGESMMTVFPHDGFKITCTSADKSGRFTQFYSVEVTPETWEKEIAPARTFCFFEEIEYLFNNGLIRGGSLENAVIIRDDAVLTNEPLRYPEEFVRHKMLDIIGDLTLLGRPLRGHVTAVRPSHAANCELVRHICAQARKAQIAVETFSPPPEEQVTSPKPTMATEPKLAEDLIQDGQTLDVVQVMKILPHRYPFLMVDKVTSVAGNKIIAQKNVSINEPYFQGHFPGHPIMPGVLQLEAIAQVAGLLMMRQAENAGKVAYFMSANDVKWRKPVRPGDVLFIEVELTKSRGRIGKANGTCRVDGEVVSEAQVTFTLVDS
jgi:UDP-3-O-[3-hydroxymyristoyl] N-acetylglucosamine deacetylase/3-hydroxyacyl-[acyl-carrier-protein] dehydratase